jgi:hypothetical protein
LDEIFGHDPEKVEFEFYCVMVARLAYEYFLIIAASFYAQKISINFCRVSSERDREMSISL